MKALRWIFYCLVCFGAGTGIALAMNPPTVGIPAADAADLRDRLALIEDYAAAGRCGAVDGQLLGAQSTVDKLPQRTNDDVVQAIQNRLDEVRKAAKAQCRAVEAEKKREETEPTTPEEVPETTPAPEPEPEPSSPDPGAGDGGPDPGTGEGETTPPQDFGDGEDDEGQSGGVPIPNGNALRQELEREARRRLREALDRSLDEMVR